MPDGHRNIHVVVLLLITFLSCGSPLEQNIEPDSTPSSSAVSDIGPTGATVELPGIAVVKFPAGAFASQVKVIIESKQADESLLKEYNESSSMHASGQAYEKALIITTPIQPKMDATIKYTVPEEFLSKIGPDSKPALFGKYQQYGANDEEIDDFEPINAYLSGNVLTATLPPEIFTNGRPSSGGKDEAIIILASYRSENLVSKENRDASFFLSSWTESNGCGADFVGSPLEGDVFVTSAFGVRLHPRSGERKDHHGVDLRANTGDNVLAVADGSINKIGFNFNPITRMGYGRYVELLHKDGSKTKYAHLEEKSTDHLKIGDSVSMGMVIGKADTTGGATGPHLHLEYEPPFSSAGAFTNRIDPYSCIVPPIRTGNITVGDALYWMFDFRIPFEIEVYVPEGNEIHKMKCHRGGDILELGYTCFAPWYNGVSSIHGDIDLIGKPRGNASVVIEIIDKLDRHINVPVSGSWDCCESGDTSYYAGVIGACIALGDTHDTTTCPVQ